MVHSTSRRALIPLLRRKTRPQYGGAKECICAHRCRTHQDGLHHVHLPTRRKDKPTPIRDQFNTDMDSYAIRLNSDRERMMGHSLVYITDGRIRWHKDHISDKNHNSPYGWSKTDWQTWGGRSLYGYAVRLLSRRQKDVHSFRRHALSLQERSPRRMGSVHGNHLRHRRVRRLRIVCTGSPLYGVRLPSKHDHMGQNRRKEYLQPPLQILSQLRNAGHNGLRRLETQVLTGKTKRQEGIAIRIER